MQMLRSIKRIALVRPPFKNGSPSLFFSRSFPYYGTNIPNFHFTGDPRVVHGTRLDSKYAPRPSIERESARPYLTPLFEFADRDLNWVPATLQDQFGLDRGSILTAISWNIDYGRPDAGARATAILDYLQMICPLRPPTKTVIMLQEVWQESLTAILQNKWVQSWFRISNIAPPESLNGEIAGQSFVMKGPGWEAGSYFTMMLISNDVPALNAFRLPLKTNMARDALVANILIGGRTGPAREPDVIRLGTTHLESLYIGKAYRPAQLASISNLLKKDLGMNQNVIGGLVGGDMNIQDKSEDAYIQDQDVRLEDAWQNGPEEIPPALKPFQRDETNGLARGNTWGYQNNNGKRQGKRTDKFLYTGSLEYLPLHSSGQVTRGIQRLGVGLHTVVEAFRYGKERLVYKDNNMTVETETRYTTREQATRCPTLFQNATQATTTAWVSDHYGILAEFKIISEFCGAHALFVPIQLQYPIAISVGDTFDFRKPAIAFST